MPTLLRFCLRLVLLAAGLVFAASMAVVFTLLLVSWCTRVLWLKLTGRPVTPFVMTFGPRAAFRRAAGTAPVGDVIEVEARRLS
jgi:branched-subunit amino acid ABC-type transport system permease component